MTTQGASIRPGLIRAAVVVWLLAGVLAMHGLTGNHDAATALKHGAHAVVPVAPDEARSASHAVAHQMPAGDPADSVAASRAPTANAVVPSSDVTVEGSSGGHGHAMGDVCLAMLTALALAVLGALVLRGLRVAHPVVRVCRRLRSAAAGPSPPWNRPTLSKLCILRT